MNILVIGNGFDLAHGLATKYGDFLEFCKKVSIIYSATKALSSESYKKNHLSNWEIDEKVKKHLQDAFVSREECKKTERDTGRFETKNLILNEFYSLIKDNIWVNYFNQCNMNGKENWIDFESEISRVIQSLDELRIVVSTERYLQDIPHEKQEILMNILKISKGSLQKNYADSGAIDDYVQFLNIELEKLVRALEIYIAEFINNITQIRTNPDIEGLEPDCVLSFNYSDTYERVYGCEKNIEYDYIHGKADVNKNVESCNLVLGIDEYLEDDRKDRELDFLVFKKFYQRIYKSTENIYLNWMDRVKVDIDSGKKVEGYTGKGRGKKVVTVKIDAKPKHTLYIFGHSLDITDKDILKMFICNDNVRTKIFYYRNSKDDKRELGKLIKNLVRIIGQDELIKRTGGIHRTIEFIPQTII